MLASWLLRSTSPGSGESAAYRPEALLDLVAQRGDGLVHLRLQGMHGVASAALELDQVTDALGLQVLAVGSAGVALVRQHALRLDALLDERIDEAWQLVHFGLVGRVHFDVLDVAVFGVHSAVAAVAEEGLVALLDPARLIVGAVHHVSLTLVIDFDVLVGASRTLDDGGIDDGATAAGDLQALALELDIDPAQQHLVELGRDEPIAEAADGGGIREAAVAGLKAGEHHEVQPDLERMLQLRVRQPVPLAQQHQLEHCQRCIGLRPAAMRGLALVQTLELVRDLGPVQQLVQLHRRRVLDQWLGAHQEEAVHALIAPRTSEPRIGEVMQRSLPRSESCKMACSLPDLTLEPHVDLLSLQPAELADLAKTIGDLHDTVQALARSLPSTKPWQRQALGQLTDADHAMQVLRLAIALERGQNELVEPARQLRLSVRAALAFIHPSRASLATKATARLAADLADKLHGKLSRRC